MSGDDKSAIERPANGTAHQPPSAAPTAQIQRGRPFQPGESGNPNGRRAGSRNRLTDNFLSAVADDFAANGKNAIERVREADPAAYLKLVSSFVPRELVLQRERQGDYSDMTLSEVEDLRRRTGHNRHIQMLIDTAT